ncbi:MAG: translocation/assembly module TamB domain-containing protein [Vicinamibacterales bacterium]
MTQHPWLRRALMGLVALAVLVALLLAVVSTAWFREQLRDVVVRRASAAINGEITIGQITGSLLHDVTLHDVLVQQKGQPVIRIASLTARFDALQLALGHYVIDDIVVERPMILLVQDVTGWNLAALVKPQERQTNTKPLDLTLRRLTIDDGTVRVEPLNQKPLEFGAVNVAGGLRYAANALGIDISRGTLVERRGNLLVSELAGHVSFAETGLTLSGLRVVSPGLILTGQIALPAAPQVAAIDLDAALSNLQLTVFNPYLPQPLPRELVLSGRAHGKGAFDQLAATWQLQSDAGASEGDVVLDTTRSPLPVRGAVRVTRLDINALTGLRDFGAPVTARATFDGVVETANPALSRLSFTLSSGPLALVGYRVDALDGKGTLDKGTLKATGRASAYAAAATFNAVIRRLDRPGAPAVSAAGKLSHLNLQRLPAGLHAPALQTDISGDYEGAFDRGEWNARLVAADSVIAGAEVRAGALATAQGQQGALSASLDGELANVPGALLRLPETRPTLLNGTVHATVAIADVSQPLTPDRVNGTVVLALGDSTVQGTRVSRADATVSLEAGRLDIRQLEIQSPGLSATALGTIVFEGAEAAQSDLTYQIDAADLSALASLGVPSLTGAAHVEGRVTGPAAQPQTTGTFSAQRLAYGTTAEALVFNGTFEAQMPNLDVEKATGKLNGESTFLTVKGQDIDRLTVAAEYANRSVDVQAKIEQKTRSVEVAAGLLLHPDHREMHLRRFVLGGFGDPWTLVGGEPAIEYADDRVAIPELTLARGDERLTAAGTIVFAGKQGGSDFNLRASGLQVGDVYTLVTGTARISGTADADVHLTGSIENPVATGTISVINGKIADAAFARIAGDVALKDRRVTVDARVEEPTGSALTVTGTAPIAADAGPLDLNVKGADISLALVQAFTTQIEKVQGTAGLDLRVTGPLAGPTVAGPITIANGGFLVSATGVMYQNLNAAVDFDGRRAAIRQFALTDDDGHSLRMTGAADVIAENGARQLDLSIQSDAIHVLEGELGDVEVSADARIGGTLAAPQVTGQLVVNRGRIEVDQLLRQLGAASTAPVEAEPDPALQTALAQPAAATTPAPGPPPAPAESAIPAPDQGLFSNATLHVNLVMPDDVVLRGRNLKTGAGGVGLGDMNLTVGGTLELRKDAGATPIVIGAVEVIRGFYEFQGRRFQVTRGSSLRFRGVQPLNPSLDVTGEREVSGIMARVRVTGTARQPALQLTSQPPLDEGDVLSLIVFNQPVNQLGEGEQVTLLERAGDLAAGALATTLSDSLGRALDVDLFEIRAPSSGQAGEVSVGNQVNERLFIAFRQQFGASEGTQLSFEYRLTEALRLLTTVGQGGSRTGASRTEAAGLDLVYLIRY